MSPLHSPLQPLRFYTQTPKKVWKAIKPHSKKKRIHVEHVYFDTGHPSIFYTGFLRARRVVDQDQPLFELDGLFDLEFRADAESQVLVSEHPVALRDVPEVALSMHGISGLLAIIGVRFERISADAKGVHLDVDVDTTYFSLRAEKPFEVGREDVARLTLRSTGPSRTSEDLLAIRDRVEHAPCTAKKWMGFYFVKQCYELPRHDELMGYEYELKLDVEDLDIDVGLLPFPVLEVNQSDSLRRYYRDHRACLRGDSAHIVEKGKVQSIGGVLKRPETKRHGINVWELPEPTMVMRRYKREINVLNPDTGRVYTLSLHHCVAGEAFQQLEIEYDGRLVPGSVTEMARFRDTHRPEHLLTIAARADAAGWSHLGDAVRQRYLDLAQDASDAEIVATSMTHKAATPLEGEHLERVESEVIDDMRLLRSALVRNGLKPSTVTKRKWLRKLYAELED